MRPSSGVVAVQQTLHGLQLVTGLPRFCPGRSEEFEDEEFTFPEINVGKIYRKPLCLMVETRLSCRFSLEPMISFTLYWNI